MSGLRVGVAHHLGWAVVVTATAGHEVVDRRRVELVGPDLPAAPIHHHGGQWELHQQGEVLDDAALATLVHRVRTSAQEVTAAALALLADEVGAAIEMLCLRAWPSDFPSDITRLRRAPYESVADSVMYRQVLADCARERGWSLRTFDGAQVEREAAAVLGPRSAEVLTGPRARLGPPWTKDHRMALAATIVAG